MLEKWTGEVVGTMHIYGITQEQIAKKMGVSRLYVSMLLNCKKTPKDAELNVRRALNELLKEVSVGYAEAEGN